MFYYPKSLQLQNIEPDAIPATYSPLCRLGGAGLTILGRRCFLKADLTAVGLLRSASIRRIFASHASTGGVESRMSEFTKILITAAPIITEKRSCEITPRFNPIMVSMKANSPI